MQRLVQEEKKVKENLTTLKHTIGGVYYFDTVSSTMDVAFSLSKDVLCNNTIIISEMQTHGRGRFGRKWVSDRNDLHLSLLLTDFDSHIPYSLIAAFAVYSTFRKYTDYVRIKWINDVLWENGKKISGVLTEEMGDRTVIGIGVNLNSKTKPSDIAELATSYYIETGNRIEKEFFIKQLMLELFPLLMEVKKGGIEQILSRWEKVSDLPGKRVYVKNENGEYFGESLGINKKTGALILEYQGRKMELYDGSITEYI